MVLYEREKEEHFAYTLKDMDDQCEENDYRYHKKTQDFLKGGENMCR